MSNVTNKSRPGRHENGDFLKPHASPHIARATLRPPPPMLIPRPLPFNGHIPILFETSNFCVVHKPAGIMVHRNKFSRKDEHGVALMQLVRDQVGRYVHPVHRLDGGTSGCLLFAYDSPTCAMLQAAMQSPTASKVYLAHCRGDGSWIKQHTVSRPIKDSEGVIRDSESLFNCIASCSDDLPERSSLIRCMPKTGRWHQLRKHLNGLSHPILGDAKHGDSRVNRWWRTEQQFQHLGLHCHELHLELPGGEALSVTCPVRPDLVHVWKDLPWWDEAVTAIPSLADDAVNARVSILSQYSREEHVDSHRVRAAAAGRGVSVFHRKAKEESQLNFVGFAPVRARDAKPFVVGRPWQSTWEAASSG